LVESNYTAHGGAHANVGAGLVALEANIAALIGADGATAARIATVSKAFSFDDVAKLGSPFNAPDNESGTGPYATLGSIDFDAPLPAGAIVIGAGVNVTAALKSIGNSYSCRLSLGVSGGDLDGFMPAGSAGTICKLGARGALTKSLVGAITPSIRIEAQCDSGYINKGTAVAYVSYIRAF
jgi:hypothetical protein